MQHHNAADDSTTQRDVPKPRRPHRRGFPFETSLRPSLISTSARCIYGFALLWIREADREPVSGVSRRHGISKQTTTYTWRKRFGGFEPNDVRRQLEAENALLKVAVERDLEIEVTNISATASSNIPTSGVEKPTLGGARLETLPIHIRSTMARCPEASAHAVAQVPLELANETFPYRFE